MRAWINDDTFYIGMLYVAYIFLYVLGIAPCATIYASLGFGFYSDQKYIRPCYPGLHRTLQLLLFQWGLIVDREQLV